MDLPGVVDAALDRSIALGYGHVGLRVRRALPGRPAERAAAQIRLQVPGADVRPVACDLSPASPRCASSPPAGEDSEAARSELWATCDRLVHEDAAREHTAGHVDR